MNYEYLPPIHRPGGARSKHDDYPPGLRWIPRWWDSKPLDDLPYMLAGNQRYWVRFCWPYEEARDIDFERLDGYCWSPKPIPRPGEWHLMMVPTAILGFPWPFPIFAITLRGGWHFRIGLARFSDDYSDEEKKPYWYSQLFSIAIKKFNGAS